MGLFYQRKNDFGDAKGKTAQFTDFLNLLGGNAPDDNKEEEAGNNTQNDDNNDEKQK